MTNFFSVVPACGRRSKAQAGGQDNEIKGRNIAWLDGSCSSMTDCLVDGGGGWGWGCRGGVSNVPCDLKPRGPDRAAFPAKFDVVGERGIKPNCALQGCLASQQWNRAMRWMAAFCQTHLLTWRFRFTALVVVQLVLPLWPEPHAA